MIQYKRGQKIQGKKSLRQIAKEVGVSCAYLSKVRHKTTKLSPRVEQLLRQKNMTIGGDMKVTFYSDYDITDVMPSALNPEKRSQISDRTLTESISKYGILQPLTFCSNGGPIEPIDGNRRLRCAHNLGITKAPVVLYDGIDPLDLMIQLNTTGQSWDVQSLAQLVSHDRAALERIPGQRKNVITSMMNILGADYDQYIRNNNVNAFTVGRKLANYLKAQPGRATRQIIFWTARHKQTRQADLAMVLGISPLKLWKYIKQDKSIEIDLK